MMVKLAATLLVLIMEQARGDLWCHPPEPIDTFEYMKAVLNVTGDVIPSNKMATTIEDIFYRMRCDLRGGSDTDYCKTVS